MPCTRCGESEPEPRRPWCAKCELAYDAWSRRHAADIVWAALTGTTIVAFAGMVLPLLGVSWLVGASGVFVGFGAFIGLHRLNGRRRRRQFLQSGDVPRAYLPGRS